MCRVKGNIENSAKNKTYFKSPTNSAAAIWFSYFVLSKISNEQVLHTPSTKFFYALFSAVKRRKHKKREKLYTIKLALHCIVHMIWYSIFCVF